MHHDSLLGSVELGLFRLGSQILGIFRHQLGAHTVLTQLMHLVCKTRKALVHFYYIANLNGLAGLGHSAVDPDLVAVASVRSIAPGLIHPYSPEILVRPYTVHR